MSQKQLQRIKVVENVAEGRLTIQQAADLLDISRRQVQRLKKRFDPRSRMVMTPKKAVKEYIDPERSTSL